MAIEWYRCILSWLITWTLILIFINNDSTTTTIDIYLSHNAIMVIRLGCQNWLNSQNSAIHLLLIVKNRIVKITGIFIAKNLDQWIIAVAAVTSQRGHWVVLGLRPCCYWWLPFINVNFNAQVIHHNIELPRWPGPLMWLHCGRGPGHAGDSNQVTGPWLGAHWHG